MGIKARRHTTNTRKTRARCTVFSKLNADSCSLTSVRTCPEAFHIRLCQKSLCFPKYRPIPHICSCINNFYCKSAKTEHNTCLERNDELTLLYHLVTFDPQITHSFALVEKNSMKYKPTEN